ncbi:lipid A deacylase LpxR family protein [Microbulbifer elongatus]|uniref:lipid A deacylase LpxR family protein n=1 Tax=Microbulbifer elongatus TaxID=86173 RepID=UPI0039A4088C
MLWTSTLWLVASSAPAVAGSLSLQLENDSFDGASDAYYTQGLQLTYAPDAPVNWPKNLLPSSYDNRVIQSQFSVGQAIYTPYEVARSDLIRDDRPYAGWLYLGGTLKSHYVLPQNGWLIAERLDVQAGIVGPSSGAEQAQRTTHQVLRAYDVYGWDHQLKDEPGFVVSYVRKWARIHPVSDNGTGVEFSGTLGGSAGNVSTQAALGLGVRVGKNLYTSAGVSALQPATVAPDFGATSAAGSWFLFSDWQTRFVSRDIFLDGNSSKPSHSVEKEPRVNEWRFGGAFAVGRYQLSVYHARRSQEFVGQYENATFSGIGLSVSF